MAVVQPARARLLSPADVEASVIPAMVDRIVRDFDPVRVVLFGSYARHEASQDSDVDLLVVLDRVQDRRGAEVAIRRALAGRGVPKDVVVATPDEIVEQGALIGSVLEPALREGRTLYERP
jgi:predicted nucleotidyltransferase